MAVERGSDRSPLCPRCGRKLHRRRRRLFHRLISVAYPVRSYVCSEECGWVGLLPSLSQLERRKRQVRVLLVTAVLAAAAGTVVWKYRADFVWSPPPPSPADQVEEVGGAQ